MPRADVFAAVVFRQTLDGHEVCETQPPAFGGERRFEHGGRPRVAARDFVKARRAYLEPAAFARVEQATEDGRAVEPRPAQPVQRAVGRDERGRVRVADERVVAYGPVAPPRPLVHEAPSNLP